MSKQIRPNLRLDNYCFDLKVISKSDTERNKQVKQKYNLKQIKYVPNNEE